MIPMIPLSPEERAMVEALDEAGLLHDIEKEHFRYKEDVAIGCCPDGRHFIRGILDPFMSMYDEANNLCFLPLPEYGGTLVLDQDSPLVLPGHTTDIDFINKIRKAVEMGYKALCLINHFPCAMARKYNIHPLRVIDSLMQAKKRIKEKEGIKGITVACFLQIADGEQRRIVRIPFKDFLLWKEKKHGLSTELMPYQQILEL